MDIWFDMDGTIANLYGKTDWLADIIAENPKCYIEATPLLNMSQLARILNKLTRQGHRINVVSWLAKGSSKAYDEKVTIAKKKWLAKHLPSVQFVTIDIIPYGEPKQNGRNGILFDDEEPNRKNWNGTAFNEHNIIEILRGLAKI